MSTDESLKSATAKHQRVDGALPAETDAAEDESGTDGRRADRKKRNTAAERHERPEHDERQTHEEERHEVPGRDAVGHGTTVVPTVKKEGASLSGLLVPGTPHAGGDPDSEREDADQPETNAEPVPEGLIHPPGNDEHEQEQGADEQVPVELHTDDSTPGGRHTGMKQEGAAADG